MKNLIHTYKNKIKGEIFINNNKGLFGAVATIVGALSLLILIGTTIYLSYSFNASIGGYLKRAANANTIELAKSELGKSLVEMEKRNMTEGSTGVLFKTPSKDVGFWYQNLKASHEELNLVDENTTQLERTNILMKLRETISDEDGLIAPSMISQFPNNTLFFLWTWFSLLVTLIFGYPIIREEL